MKPVTIFNWLAIGFVTLVVLTGLVAVAWVLFVLSVGTAVDFVNLDATVVDRQTRRPVGDCLLAFGYEGYPYNKQRTDENGQVHYKTSQQHGTSIFLQSLWRDRKVGFRFHLGRPPHYGTFEKVEMWDVDLIFRQPWRDGTTFTPRTEVKRFLSHEEVLNPPPGKKWQIGGDEPLPAAPPETLAAAEVQFHETKPRVTYDVRLTVFLDQNQITACQKKSE